MPGHQPIPRPVDLTDLPNPMQPHQPMDQEPRPVATAPAARALTVVALYQVQRDRYEEAARVLAGLSRVQLGRVVECAAILGDLATTALLTTVPAESPSPFTPMQIVLDEVAQERAAQDAKWGQQNHDDHPADADNWLGAWTATAEGWKRRNADRVAVLNAKGAPSDRNCYWDGILLEEVFEAVAEEDPLRLRAELVQVAAVAVAQVEAIDRRLSAGIRTALTQSEPVPDTMPEPIPQADPDPEPELTAAVFDRINAGRASQSAPWVGRGAVRRILAVLRERPEPPNTDEGLAAVAMLAGVGGGPVARLMVREVMAALPDGKSPATPAEGVSDVR